MYKRRHKWQLTIHFSLNVCNYYYYFFLRYSYDVLKFIFLFLYCVCVAFFMFELNVIVLFICWILVGYWLLTLKCSKIFASLFSVCTLTAVHIERSDIVIRECKSSRKLCVCIACSFMFSLEITMNNIYLLDCVDHSSHAIYHILFFSINVSVKYRTFRESVCKTTKIPRFQYMTVNKSLQ